MTIHFFTKGDMTSATARYRGFLLAKELNRLDYKTITHEPPSWRPFFSLGFNRFKEFWRHFKILSALKSADVIYLIRTVYQYDFLLLAVFFRIFFRRKYVFDFDDPIFLRPGFKLKMIIAVKFAGAVMAGSHFLAEWAKRYNNNVYVMPTCVPFKLYGAGAGASAASLGAKLVLGWVGNAPFHYENLRLLVPVFTELILEGVKFKFILVGADKNKKIYELFKSIKGLDVCFIDELIWSDPANVIREIKKFDLGLMPLMDNEWNRGKCAFKAIEYMACGVPAVISPVGENKYLVQTGVNGYLADSAEEWARIIKNVCRDRSSILPLGKKAQETIRRSYSLEAMAPKIAEIIKGLK